MSEVRPEVDVHAPRLGCAFRVALVPESDFNALPSAAPLESCGLGYLFSRPTRVRFWALGFAHPIEQVFVHETGAIVAILQRLPGDPGLAGPETDVLAVFELEAGTCARLGLASGERLTLGDTFRPEADPGLIAIVQSDRAGWYLACELRARGHRIIHVHPIHHLEEVPETEFDLALVWDDDLDEVLPTLIALGPRLVLAGSELGVNAADYFAEALALPGNGTRLSVARRDKAGMVAAVRAAGLPAMRQLKARTPSRILAWMDRHRLPAVVIKPLRSAGTDRVALCRSEREVRVAVAAIRGAVNRLGLREVEVLAQEALEGPEIYLNSTSRDGRHTVTEIWLETKRHAPAGRASDGSRRAATPFSYDTFQLLPGDDPLARHLTAWLVEVLDALEIRWGPAHTELILTPRGPRLIDFGARLDGVLLPALNEACLGKSPVQLTADAYLDPGAWEDWARAPYRLKSHATMVVVDNPRSGRLRDDSGLRALSQLPSYHALRPRWSPGEDVPESRDAFTYHSIVTLVAPEAEVVRADAREVRAREREGLLLDVMPLIAPGGKLEALAPHADPRTSPAWGQALADFGWRSVEVPDRPGEVGPALLAYLRDDRDGPALWVPRQRDLDLLRIDALARTLGSVRTILEPAPALTLRPRLDPPFTLPGGEALTDEVLERHGLAPTQLRFSPQFVELIPTTDGARLDVEILEGPLDADLVEAAFRNAGAGETARWPASLAAAAQGAVSLARVVDPKGYSGVALAFIHDGLAHVAAAVAGRRSLLKRVVTGLASHLGQATPNTTPRSSSLSKIESLDSQETRPPRYLVFDAGDHPLGLGEMVVLPPALRLRPPSWTRYLDDPALLLDTVRGDTSPAPTSSLARRLAARSHPLATWRGTLWAQAMGRTPLLANATPLHLLREEEGGPAHAVACLAPGFDLVAAHAVGASRELLWVAWEPPLEAVADGAEGPVALRWDPVAPERYLETAAALGLVPVRSRWTTRRQWVVDLATVDMTRRGDLEIAISSALTDKLEGQMRAIDAVGHETLEESGPADASGSEAHNRKLARGRNALALGFGGDLVIALWNPPAASANSAFSAYSPDSAPASATQVVLTTSPLAAAKARSVISQAAATSARGPTERSATGTTSAKTSPPVTASHATTAGYLIAAVCDRVCWPMMWAVASTHDAELIREALVEAVSAEAKARGCDLMALSTPRDATPLSSRFGGEAAVLDLPPTLALFLR